MSLARYYDVLGVSPAADEVVVTAAYRALMRKYHPDVNGAIEAGSHAALINEAYAALREGHGRTPDDAAPAYDVRRHGERRRPGSERRAGPERRRGHDRREGDRRNPAPMVRGDAEPMVVKILVLVALLAASSLAFGTKAESASDGLDARTRTNAAPQPR